MNFPRISALNALLCLPLLACTADKGETDTDTASSLTDATTSAGTGTTADPGTTAAETTATATDATTAQVTTGDDPTSTGTTGNVTTVTTGDDTTGDDTTGDDTTGDDTTGDDTTGDGTTGDDTSTGEPAGLSWALDVHPVSLAKSCGCHAQGVGGLTMTNAMDSYAVLVGVQSNGSGLKRVEPGAPDDSYLLYKLRGTHINIGGAGQQMPLGGAPLPEATIDLIEQWIVEGAKP